MPNDDQKRVRYEVFGPFRLNRLGSEKPLDSLKRLWAEVEADGSDSRHKNLSEAVGVYVWTYKKGRKWFPWNVGLTDRQGFKARFKQKIRTFLEFYEPYSAEKRPDIEVFLLALLTPGGGFRKPTQGKTIGRNHWLEGLLIGSALTANPDLRNFAKVGKLKSTIVDGYLNDEGLKLTSSATSFGALFKA